MAPKEKDASPKMETKTNQLESGMKQRCIKDKLKDLNIKTKLLIGLTIVATIVATIVGVITIFEYIQNQPPEANFEFFPAKPKIGEEIIFISRSIDDNISECNLFWDFGDGNVSVGDLVKHSYHAAGKFTVSLTVQDKSGVNDSAMNVITIDANKLPVAVFSWVPNDPKVGNYVSFDASESRDDDGIIVTYYWDFGDGVNSSDPSPEHYYAQSGKFEVRLKVTDDVGGSNQLSRTITVIEPDPVVIPNKPPTAYFDFNPGDPKVGDKINFDASKSYDPDGQVTAYKWDLGDENLKEGPVIDHSYFKDGTFPVLLTVIDDEGEEDTEYRNVTVETNDPYPGFTISNILDGSKVPQSTTLIGKYPTYLEDDIWLFVMSPSGMYYPQSIDPGNITWKTPKIDGKWEVRVGLGGPNDDGEYFELVLMVADQKASKNISETLKRWNDTNNYPGWRKAELPPGVEEKKRITVVRTAEMWAPAPDISNTHLRGEVSYANIADNDQVPFQMDIDGNCSSDLEGYIWVLVYPTNARWYPQSISACEGVHSLKANETWRGSGTFGGEGSNIGEPFDVVAILSDESANDFFDSKQREWCKAEHYPGLLTIELPQGIEEKDRVRVKQI